MKVSDKKDGKWVFYRGKGVFSWSADITFMIIVGILISIYFIGVNYLSKGSFDNKSENLIQNTLFSVSISILLYIQFRFMFQYLNKNFPWTDSIMGRIIRQVPLIFLISAVSMLVFMKVWDLFLNTFDYSAGQYYINIITAVIVSFILNTIYEGVNLFRQLKNKELEAEMLKRQNIESHFETLKNQVGPHFLFNSLNTLISLMDEDIPAAKKFVENLAAYYRYTLQINELNLIDLDSELKLVESYYFLLQSRFGTNLKIEFDNSLVKIKSQLVPLSMQMLVENAVKHNIISSEKPLIIKIGATANSIYVENNLQIKESIDSSNGIGLENILNRYRLSAGKEISIYKDEVKFRVELPLI
ncbi:MAG: histidine kinase [Bacteroidia bacterium]